MKYDKQKLAQRLYDSYPSSLSFPLAEMIVETLLHLIANEEERNNGSY